MTVLGSLIPANGSTADPGEGGRGVLAAWESADPVVAEARSLVQHGRWSEAATFLAEPHEQADPAADSARQEMSELLARLRWEYSADTETLAARIRPAMPGVGSADLERWRLDGGLQWREVDGGVAYFRREPANLFRFCAEAKGHAPPAKVASVEASYAATREHLARIIAEARRTGETGVLPVRYRVRYSLTAPRLKAGARVRAWLPFPQEYRQQQEVRLIQSSPRDAVIAPAAEGAFPLRGAPQRSVYFEQRVGEEGAAVSCTAEFEFTTSGYYPALDDAAARPLPKDYAEGSTGERPPHIRFTPEVMELAGNVTRGHDNPLDRARQIFLWVSANIAYAAEEEYCLIPSLSVKALDKRRGDCGVKAMTFITLCRAAGIPARWQSGWTLGPGDPDMHDWAEFYVAPWGWLPADTSRGLQASEDPAVRDFYFGHQDALRLIVNRDYGCALQPPKQSIRSEPLDFQRGEVEVDGVNLYFNTWDYKMQVVKVQK